jgi:hypothetical protein
MFHKRYIYLKKEKGITERGDEMGDGSGGRNTNNWVGKSNVS